MLDFVLLSLPIFGIVALGWLALKMRWVSDSIIEPLGEFSFRFALPVLLFQLLVSQPIEQSFHPVFLGTYFLSGLLLFIGTFGISRFWGKLPATTSGGYATTATVSNLGFLGAPLLLAFIGQSGTGPLAMAILVEMMFLLSLGSIIMGTSCGKASFSTLILRGTLLNPVVMSVVLGAIIAISGITLPTPIQQFMRFLAGAAGPTALFALGGTLAVQKVSRETIWTALGISIAKLILYPSLVWLSLSGIPGLNPVWLKSGVLLAALPPAASNYVIAQRYGANVENTSAAIMLSTVISAFSIPFIAWLLHL